MQVYPQLLVGLAVAAQPLAVVGAVAIDVVLLLKHLALLCEAGDTKATVDRQMLQKRMSRQLLDLVISAVVVVLIKLL